MRFQIPAAKQIMVAKAVALAGSILASGAFSSLPAQVDHPMTVSEPDKYCDLTEMGSPYIPVDSWIYPAVLRLYSLGFLDHVYLGLRPWTQASLLHMLADTGPEIENTKENQARDEAESLYLAVKAELNREAGEDCAPGAHLESTYTQLRGISGTPLRDSYHLGSTIVNDYGRPFEEGFNSASGASGYAHAGRFVLYLRGELESAPSAVGYSAALAQTLSNIDATTILDPATGTLYNQPTIPQGPISTATQGRFLEAYVSAQYANHVFSFGKQDEWLGPAEGGSMAYSNNAENIYAFHVNRIEPLYIPFLSNITGPFRYEFLVGALRGHTLIPNPDYPGPNQPNSTTQPNVTNPGDPWVHVEKISFRPTDNLEFGFERTALWGGEGHSPVTIHTFLRSFFSLTAGQPAVKFSRNDPGARFGAFDFSWRLPYLRHWLTLYYDSEVHDDVSPVDVPRRSSMRPGLYLSHFPGLPRLDLRVEGVNTDPPVTNSNGGQYMYYEVIEKEGYTNQGQLFGDWIGREDKGGQAWATWHLSGNEWIQASMRRQKAAKDFIPGGTTLNEFDVQVVKRIGREFELTGSFAAEGWKAPSYLTGPQTNTVTTMQLTWLPKDRVKF
jgi:hypothetical protein